MHANRMADAGGHALGVKQELTTMPSRDSEGDRRLPLATIEMILNDSRLSHEGKEVRSAGLALAFEAYRAVGGYSTVNTAKKVGVAAPRPRSEHMMGVDAARTCHLPEKISTRFMLWWDIACCACQ